jgi:hypothetical protein
LPVEGFDYQEFAQSLRQQAEAAMPAELADQNKQFLIQVIFDFSTKAGEALVHEDNDLITAEGIQMVIQFIAEWSFHKGLELMNSSIPPETWLFILQTIAGGIYEAGKRSLIGGLDQNMTYTIIQGEVESQYTHAINILKEEGKITDEHINSIHEAHMKAQEQIVVGQDEQAQQQQPQAAGPQLDAKNAKLATVGILLSTLPVEKAEGILDSFSPDEADIIRGFMHPEDSSVQIDPTQAFKLLNSLKSMIAPQQAPTQMAKYIQTLVSETGPAQVIKILQKERPIVQNYVKSCIEGKFIRRDFSPHLAKIIYKYLEKELYSA